MLGKRTFPNFLVFFAFCDVLCFFPLFFFLFSLFHVFQLRVRVLTAVRFWGVFVSTENSCFIFSLLAGFFLFPSVLSFFVTSDERGQG